MGRYTCGGDVEASGSMAMVSMRPGSNLERCDALCESWKARELTIQR